MNRRKPDTLIDEIVEFIGKGIDRACSQFPRLAGIGLAANGIIDAERGVIIHCDPEPTMNSHDGRRRKHR